MDSKEKKNSYGKKGGGKREGNEVILMSLQSINVGMNIGLNGDEFDD